MVSKNNLKLRDQWTTKQVPHYGLRKLGIGVASVLLSTTLYVGVNAHADTLSATTEASATLPTQTKALTTDTSGQATASVTPTTNNGNSSLKTTAEEGETVANNNAVAASQPAVQNATVPTKPTSQPVPANDADHSSTAPRVNRPMRLMATPAPAAQTTQTVNSTWTIHYVKKGDHSQELAPSTTAKMQYTRTVDGSNYGDWSYVKGSFNESGNQVKIENGDSQTKQDNITQNGKSIDEFGYTLYYPTIPGYSTGDYNRVNLANQLYNDETQALTMAKDYYVEYEADAARTDTVDFSWTIHYYDKNDKSKEIAPPTTITHRFTRQVQNPSTAPIYGDWTYVPGSVKQTGTPVQLVNDGVPIKSDNVVSPTNSENSDKFSFTVAFPAVKGYQLYQYDRIQLSDYLTNVSDVENSQHGENEALYTKLETVTVRTHATGTLLLETPSGSLQLSAKPNDSGNAFYTIDRDLSGTAVMTSPNVYGQLDFPNQKYDAKTVNVPTNLTDLYIAGTSTTLGQWLKQNGYDGAYASGVNTLSELTKIKGYDFDPQVVDPSGSQYAMKDDKIVTGITFTGSSVATELDRIGATNGDGTYTAKGTGTGGPTWTSNYNFMVAITPYKNLTKIVTRTINLHKPDGLVTETQKVTLAGHKSVQLSNDGTARREKEEYNTDTWAEYTPPVLTNYSISPDKVNAVTVKGTTPDATVDVYYTLEKGQITYKMVDDDDGGKELTDKEAHLRGGIGTTAETHLYAPMGYEPAPGNTIPEQSAPFKTDPQTITIHLRHIKEVITADSPFKPGDKLSQNIQLVYPADIAKDNLRKVITRTINVHEPGKPTATTTQKVTLNRSVTIDQVTGKAVGYTPWTTGEWAAFNPPQVAGYAVTPSTIAKVAVTDQTKDTTVEVNYQAGVQAAHIKYVDDDNKQAVVKTTDLQGKTGEQVPTNIAAPTNYILVNPSANPASYTFNAGTNPDLIVHVKHQHATVTPDQPNHGVTTDQLTKSVTRTIKVVNPDQSTKTTTQTVKLTRNADVDLVTNQVTYGKWSTGEWPAFTPATINGYTPSQTTVAKTPVTETTQNQTITITYQAGQHSMHINYIDNGDGKTVVHQQGLAGNTGDSQAVKNEVPAGWQLVTGQTLPTTITFGADGHADVNVKIEHKHVTVTPDHPKTPADKLPDNPTQAYPNGVTANDLTKTITRIIKVINPDKSTKTTTQTVKLTRTADVDEVTGQVTYGKWSTGQWAAFTTPTITGYTASQSAVPVVSVDSTTKDQTITITYQAGQHGMHINYIDNGDGKTVVHQQGLAGNTGDSQPVKNEVPAGWQLVAGQTLPTTITFGTDGHADVNVKIEHKHVTVTPDAPKTTIDQLPDNPSQTYPTGVGTADLTKIVTRTIQVVDPQTGKVSETKQTVKLTRTADVDEVTKAVKYNDWTTGTWVAFTTPTLKGYEASQATVAEAPVTAATQDQTVKITYTAKEASDFTMKLTYVDANHPDQVLQTQTFTGKAGSQHKVPSDLPAGWQLADGERQPTIVIFGDQGHADMVVKLVHQHVKVTADQPKTTHDRLPDNPTMNYPAGVTHDDLTKTVVRTINVTHPNGEITTMNQAAVLTRAADVDEVTGEVTYEAWSSGEWDGYTVPTYAGYTPSMATVDAATVTSETKDSTVTITYHAVEQSQALSIEYVDDDANGKVVKTQTLQGKVGQVLPVTYQIDRDKYQIVDEGKLPATVTLQKDGNQLQVHVRHLITSTVEHQAKTRTIIVTAPDGTKTTTPQVVDLVRYIAVDQVTGEQRPGEWSTGQWSAYQVPTIAGYTPSQTLVDAVNVTAATKDDTVNVTYTVADEPAQPTPEPAQPTSENDVPATPVPAKNSEAATGVTTQPAPLSAANVATGDATPAGQAQLPQTGDTGDTALILAGLAITGSQLALLGIRKKAGQR